ncbi:DUF4976 domain-containing protein [Flammeovirga pectinis]|uniref:DUF4976 domain-containing protein n=1 Tax=Flammeovirga pectinis TaxID=2494373 RepID=A0A3Q9FSD5_9BACT|nr:sulfatase [Flammeovirga pectinis]AZQ64976.1 DUF4976 domain-containing protein [Flammeovirga pectinis]
MKYQILLILLTFSTLVFADKEKPKEKEKPNVVLIMVDDLNDYVGFLGGHPQTKTPAMDKLADRSVIFTNAFSNDPICNPSRASFSTGLYPHTTHFFGFNKFLKNETLMGSKTMFEHFKDNGYTTVGIGKLLHTNINSVWNAYGDQSDFGPFPYDGEKKRVHPSVPAPFDQAGALDGGYASLKDIPTVNGVTGWFDKVKGWPKLEVKPFKYINDEDRDLMPDEVKVQDAKKFIKKFENENSEKPFFLGVGFNRPHTPLYVPQKYFDMFPLADMKLPETGGQAELEGALYGKVKEGNHGKRGYNHFKYLVEGYDNDRDLALRTYIQAYLACIAFVDDQIAGVIKAIEESKFADNTVVVLVSDHAYNMGDKDYLYKFALWDKSTRIPMLVHNPGQKKAIKVTQPVSLIDIYPTLVDLCSLEGSTIKDENGKPLDGHSMVPLYAKNAKQRWQGPDYALSAISGGMGDKFIEKQHYTIRTEQYRYIRYADGQEELYDHATDPNEFANVAKQEKYKGVITELSQKLNKQIGITN